MQLRQTWTEPSALTLLGPATAAGSVVSGQGRRPRYAAVLAPWDQRSYCGPAWSAATVLPAAARHRPSQDGRKRRSPCRGIARLGGYGDEVLRHDRRLRPLLANRHLLITRTRGFLVLALVRLGDAARRARPRRPDSIFTASPAQAGLAESFCHG